MTVPVSLYIHTPWCIKKCPYCDFNSHGIHHTLPEELYIDTLIQDFESKTSWLQNRPLHSIFIGGGTPSLLSWHAYEKLFHAISKKINITDIEITLEANPGTLSLEKLIAYKSIGINRISLGVQSFQEHHLKTLGRIHNSNEAIEAIENIIKANFSTFNIDIMHGLPQQTLDEAISDIKMACNFSPPHLSWYQLTIEPNTYFASYPPTLPKEPIMAAIENEGKKLLSEQYHHYEISAFAKQNHLCKHNLNYWNFGDYIGIGAGAHSKMTNLSNYQTYRYANIKHPTKYMEQKRFLANENRLSNETVLFEFMLNVLRLHQPISYQILEERTCFTRQQLKKACLGLIQEQLLWFNENEFGTTPLGKQFLNDVTAHFLPEESSVFQ